MKTATYFFWRLVSATALSVLYLATFPFLPYHMQGMRRKTELTPSTLVPSHDSFHIPFSFFKQLQAKIKTLMSGFSQILITHNKEKSIVCILFFFKHETCQWDILRLPFRDTAWTSIAEQCRCPFTACLKIISRFLHSGSSLPEITALPFRQISREIHVESGTAQCEQRWPKCYFYLSRDSTDCLWSWKE